MSRPGDAGFTLLEIVAVVAIVSMLVGLGVPIAEMLVTSEMMGQVRNYVR